MLIVKEWKSNENKEKIVVQCERKRQWMKKKKSAKRIRIQFKQSMKQWQWQALATQSWLINVQQPIGLMLRTIWIYFRNPYRPIRVAMVVQLVRQPVRIANDFDRAKTIGPPLSTPLVPHSLDWVRYCLNSSHFVCNRNPIGCEAS